eukprot:PhM_4_TR12695/c0_g1_i1/m.105198
MTVGPSQLPPSQPSTLKPRPSSSILAPSFSALLMMSTARSRAARVIMGPTSTPSTWPGPTLSTLARCASSGIHARLSPTKTATERAMQRWPDAPMEDPMSEFSACSLSASGMMTPWFLAPRLAWTRLPCFVPTSWMYSPAALPPTKEMARMGLLLQMKSTVGTPPCTTLRTPLGTPACSASLTSSMTVCGTFSEGFSTIVLPHASAMGNIHSGIMAGKLKGQMPAVTPRGCLNEYRSMWWDTLSSVSPCISEPMPQACSTTSSPRKTSPLASVSVLPCSCVSTAARRSMFERTRSWYLSITRARLDTLTSDHDFAASALLATAASSSSGVDWGTRESSSPVAGLTTSKSSEALDCTSWPLMYIGTVGTAPRTRRDMRIIDVLFNRFSWMFSIKYRNCN